MRNTRFIILALLVVFAGFGCNKPQEFSKENVLFEAKKNGLIMDENEIFAMADPASLTSVTGENPDDVKSILLVDKTGWKAAALADVTGGGSFGLAHTTVENGVYTLFVSMGNLPELRDGYFYEGWIVRRGDEMSVVSTGHAKPNGDAFVNVFTSRTDLLDHTFFVLTLESDDNNPAPSEHILEGRFR